jgi:membrane protein DedA with SNARE-associated domain
MDIAQITATLQRDAVWVVFFNVLLQQLGLPVPAVPTLLVAGSLALSSGQAGMMLAAAVLASMLADWVWYLAGRAFGYRVLAGLCKLSINPGSCVSATEARFVRWGVWSLVVAKFVPGFSTVGPPIAGSMRMPLTSFIVAAGVGAALWAGGAILVGWLLRSEVQTAMDILSRHATTAVVVIALAIGAWIAWKLWQKHRFDRLATSLITPRADGGFGVGRTALVPRLSRCAMSPWGRSKRDAGAVGHCAPVTAQRRRIVACARPEDATAVRAANELTGNWATSVRPLRKLRSVAAATGDAAYGVAIGHRPRGNDRVVALIVRNAVAPAATTSPLHIGQAPVSVPRAPPPDAATTLPRRRATRCHACRPALWAVGPPGERASLPSKACARNSPSAGGRPRSGRGCPLP